MILPVPPMLFLLALWLRGACAECGCFEHGTAAKCLDENCFVRCLPLGHTLKAAPRPRPRMISFEGAAWRSTHKTHGRSVCVCVRHGGDTQLVERARPRKQPRFSRHERLECQCRSHTQPFYRYRARDPWSLRVPPFPQRAHCVGMRVQKPKPEWPRPGKIKSEKKTRFAPTLASDARACDAPIYGSRSTGARLSPNRRTRVGTLSLSLSLALEDSKSPIRVVTGRGIVHQGGARRLSATPTNLTYFAPTLDDDDGASEEGRRRLNKVNACCGRRLFLLRVLCEHTADRQSAGAFCRRRLEKKERNRRPLGRRRELRLGGRAQRSKKTLRESWGIARKSLSLSARARPLCSLCP